MQFITNITQKGQVTIPKKIRDALNLKAYDTVKVERKNGAIAIKRQPDLLDLAGSLAKYAKGKPSVLKAREIMEKTYRRF